MYFSVKIFSFSSSHQPHPLLQKQGGGVGEGEEVPVQSVDQDVSYT